MLQPLRQRCLVWLVLLAAAGTVLPLPVQVPKHLRGEDGQQHSNQNSVLKSDVSPRPIGEESGHFEGDIKLRPGEHPYDETRVTHESNKTHIQTSPTEDSNQTSTAKVGEMRSKRDLLDSAPKPTDRTYETRTDLWEEGVVYFKYDTNLNTMYRTVFKRAMAMWNNTGCVQFRDAEDNTTDYIMFKQDEENGCSSYVGRFGGEQEVTISSKCSSVGSAVHEIGHALGMWHEHSRRDRDDYIEIFEDNIIATERDNFGILSVQKFNQVPPVSYDIESIMHYGPYSFTQNQEKAKPSIRVREDAPWDMCDKPDQMGQRERLSHKDILRLKLLYKCGEVTPTDLPKGCAITPSTPSPTLPSPTTTKAATIIPTPTLTTKLLPNDVITLEMGPTSNRFAMKCVPSPGCTPTPCLQPLHGSEAHCSDVKNQFKIIKPAESNRIRSGDKVLLRSMHKPSLWLNCSGLNKECTISPCTSNAADPSNSSYISDCEEHYFIISGLNRAPKKVLSTKHKIRFKSFKEDGLYLNCIGKKCQLLEENVCPKLVPLIRSELLEENCTAQYFNVKKH